MTFAAEGPPAQEAEVLKVLRVTGERCPEKYLNASKPSEHLPSQREIVMAISPTGGVFSYLPHHLDLASEDSVGHSTCMSVLARRRAIMGSIVQPKRSCLGAATGTAESPHRWGK